MTLGKAPFQSDMFSSGADLCEVRLGESSVYRLLHRECHRLFPDELFADLFTHVGRRSVPPRIDQDTFGNMDPGSGTLPML